MIAINKNKYIKALDILEMKAKYINAEFYHQKWILLSKIENKKQKENQFFFYI